MGETHSCTYSNCDKVFSKAYDLKKHIADHENPNNLFHCPRCDFVSLRKDLLARHFVTHFSKKCHECPDMIRTGNREQPCKYRTSDLSALTKHRKKQHGYIPLANRSRPKASVCKTRKEKEEKSKPARRRKLTQPIAPSPRRKATCSPRKTRNPKSGLGNSSTSADRTPSLFQVPIDVDGNAMDTDGSEDFGYVSSATLIGTDDEVGLDTLSDPTLRSAWMAQYELSYTSFDMSGMRSQLETLAADPILDPALLDDRTGREGCLCPEWMVEAGIEGWDELVLEVHKEYYAVDA